LEEAAKNPHIGRLPDASESPYIGKLFELRNQYTPENETLRKNILKDAGVTSDTAENRALWCAYMNVGNDGKFTKRLFVCGCHLSWEDIQPGRRHGSFTLPQTARLRTLKYLVEYKESNLPSKRPAPVERGTGDHAKRHKQAAESEKARAERYKTDLASATDELSQVQKSKLSLQEQIEAAAIMSADKDEKIVILKESVQVADKNILQLRQEIKDTKMLLAAEQVKPCARCQTQGKLAGELQSRVDSLKEKVAMLQKQPLSQARLKKIRVEIRAAEAVESNDGLYTLEGVHNICSAAGAMTEYTRLEDLLGLAGLTDQERIQRMSTSKFPNKAKRVVSTWFLAMDATSERLASLSASFDTVANHKFEVQGLASNLGVGQSRATVKRRRTAAINDFDRKFEAELTRRARLNTDTPSAVLVGDDDFTRHWYHKMYVKGSNFVTDNIWAILAVKLPSSVPAPFVEPNKPVMRKEPRFFSPQSTAVHIVNVVKFSGSFMDLVETIDHLLEDYVQATGAMRRRVEQHEYAGASTAYKERMMQDVLLMDILPQPFKSYLDMARSILRQLASAPLFSHLEANYIVVSVGDWPKQHHERIFLLQGDGRGDSISEYKGASYLGHLFYIADPDLFLNIMDRHAMENLDCAKERIGKAAMNIHQELGPLHLKINPVKDFGMFWFEILLSPLHFSATNTKLKAKPHLRQITGLLEVLNAAWLKIRVAARPALLRHAHRFDAGALLWALENTLPLCMILYDVVFKSGQSALYFEGLCHLEVQMVLWQRHNYDRGLLYKLDSTAYLKKIGHNLHAFIGDKCHIVDESFLEGGVNARLAALTRNMQVEEQARNIAKRDFYKRTDPSVANMNAQLAQDESHMCSFTGRKIDAMVLLGCQLLTSLVARIVNAAPSEYPQRVHKSTARPTYNTDRFVCPTLSPNPEKPLTANSHEIGNPGYALNYSSRVVGPNKRINWVPNPDAPDGFSHSNGCSMQYCIGGLQSTDLRQLMCGHRICEGCCSANSSDTCAICSEKLQSKLVSLATKEAETMATRVITEEELLQGTAVVAASASEEDSNQGSGPVSTSSNSLPELLAKLKALSQNSQP
jgi:hypothetical protein